MILNISDESVFYLTLLDPEGHELAKAINPIAEGLVIKPAEKTEQFIATFSWFDIGADHERIMLLKEPPKILENGHIYKLKNMNDYTFVFRYIDKQLYDNTVCKLMHGPHVHFDTDAEVQAWFKNQ